jgi:hypothetical protein
MRTFTTVHHHPNAAVNQGSNHRSRSLAVLMMRAPILGSHARRIGEYGHEPSYLQGLPSRLRACRTRRTHRLNQWKGKDAHRVSGIEKGREARRGSIRVSFAVSVERQLERRICAENRKGCDIGYAPAIGSCEEANSVDTCTVAALDAITAFAVPNPNCSSQSQSVFSGLAALQVTLASKSLSLLRTSKVYFANPFSRRHKTN